MFENLVTRKSLHRQESWIVFRKTWYNLATVCTLHLTDFYNIQPTNAQYLEMWLAVHHSIILLLIPT
jgi:hypothetical protein